MDQISKYLVLKRFRRRLKSKEKKYIKRKNSYLSYIELKHELGTDISYENQLKQWLSKNLWYILDKIEDTDYTYKDFSIDYSTLHYKIKTPKIFCLNSNTNTSLRFIYTLLYTILSDSYKKITIDYSKCRQIDLSAQIYLDIILVDLLKFLQKRDQNKKTKPFVELIGGNNINDKDIRKILFSIGSPAIINKRSYKFDDIIPYNLCIHNKDRKGINNTKRKEIDTTTLVEHVLDSLSMMKKSLSYESIENLSTVVGEILINAEEHSTLNYRYSTGYFQKIENEKLAAAYGIYHLVIMNFGDTIYEKFKSPKCTNYDIKDRMRELSENYTKKRWFSKSFHEETLWTLYALQEGVTSVPIERYKRGNGSIRFIESFFNLKANPHIEDKISRLSLISGNTNIVFDGCYEIKDKVVGKDKFKVMTFNTSGDIEDKPDKKYVKYIKDYFPGTIISAKILITEDDLI